MKNTNFSETQFRFLNEEVDLTRNHVNQLRYRIKEKASNMRNDLKLLLSLSKVDNKDFKNLISKSLLADITKTIFTEYPELSLSILRLNPVKDFLGQDFIKEYFCI